MRVPTRRQGSNVLISNCSDLALQMSREFLERYEVFEVNEGGFAYVLGVSDRLSHEEFAVKMPKSQSMTSLTMEEFAKEVAIWVQLDPHPNIVTARFVRNVGSGPALFMEYVRGTAFRTLRELITMGPLSEESALTFALQICLGMEFANRRREVVHLDLKPENLLIDRGTLLKITDFGLAHQVRVIRGSYERRFAGSWPYAPPERFQQQPCDSSSDMFSIGVILYEMLTGRLPYPFILDEDPASAYAQLADFHAKHGRHAVVRGLCDGELSGVSPDVIDILNTFLQPDREYRPRNFRKAISFFQDSGTHQLPTQTVELTTENRVARVSALQAIGKHSAALVILNALLIKEPDNGKYYLAAVDSLVATGQSRLAEEFRKRAAEIQSRAK